MTVRATARARLVVGLLPALVLGPGAVAAEVVARVSVAPDGSPGNGSSGDPAVSADGRVVAFRSRATNLVPGVSTSTVQVYARDRATATTELISAAGDGTPASSDTDNFPALSANGRFTVNAASERAGFLAYPATFLGGVTVAVGDVRRRGRASIVTGPALGARRS